MANNYYDATGVLVLKEVTPVIKALFGCFDLDASYPGDGEVYIAQMAESTVANWEAVLEGLQRLCKDLGISPEEDSALKAHLYVLATHFEQDDNYALGNLIDGYQFDEMADADLAVLFDLARAFDDGHGLTAIKSEGCWHCDKPRLFEFGGYGEYFGRHFTMGSRSTEAVLLGSDVDGALEAGDMDLAAAVIARKVNALLAGVTDSSVREVLAEKVASAVQSVEQVAAPSPA